jgi:cytoskeletal protein CcmA (bactofilin family)
MEMSEGREFARIGKSVIIKGELSGSEDLYVDGQVEGTIELSGAQVFIGAEGQVRASINAKRVVVQGKLDGNVRASDSVELQKSAVTVGDVTAKRISIEDGAYLKGKVEIERDEAGKAGKTPVTDAGKK